MAALEIVRNRFRLLETGNRKQIEQLNGHWSEEEEDILQVLIILFSPD